VRTQKRPLKFSGLFYSKNTLLHLQVCNFGQVKQSSNTGYNVHEITLERRGFAILSTAARGTLTRYPACCELLFS